MSLRQVCLIQENELYLFSVNVLGIISKVIEEFLITGIDFFNVNLKVI